MNNSRYILEAFGSVSISPTNNSILTVTNTSVNERPSSIIINLNNLDNEANSSSGSSTTSNCVFDVYSVYNGTSFLPDYINNVDYACSLDSDGFGNNVNLPHDNGNVDNIFSFRDEFLTELSVPQSGGSSVATITNTTATFIPSTGDGNGLNSPHCRFVVSGYPCDQITFDGADPLYYSDHNGDPISPTTGTVTVPSGGVTITCETNNSIMYNYTGFDAIFENSCSNPNLSFIVFTPKNTTSGLQSLGNSTNHPDGSVNIPFYITSVENQTGDFYIEPICSIDDNAHHILISALDDVYQFCSVA